PEPKHLSAYWRNFTVAGAAPGPWSRWDWLPSPGNMPGYEVGVAAYTELMFHHFSIKVINEHGVRIMKPEFQFDISRATSKHCRLHNKENCDPDFLEAVTISR